jgi:hypothetical protein
MTNLTAAQIQQIATSNGMTTKTVINGVFSNQEKFSVNLGSFKTAYFIMNNQTLNYSFEKVYNAATDKTSFVLPLIFK